MPDRDRPVPLDYEFVGPSGAPVLALATSLGTTRRMWDPQVPDLARHFRLLRFDTRGHGRSPAPAGDYTIADLGHDVLALLDTLDLERVSYCGLSLGGIIGMWLAAHAPDRVARLALCCTSAYLPPAEAWAQRAATVRAEGTGAIVDTVMARWFTPSFHQRQPQTVARFAAMLAGTPAQGYAGCCAAIGTVDLRPELAKIAAQTLVVAGEHDPSTPPECGSEIAEAIPDARLTVVPAAHLANVEAPAPVTSALIEHLAR